MSNLGESQSCYLIAGYSKQPMPTVAIVVRYFLVSYS